MKTTDLQAMGLEEMNEVQMQEVDGGIAPLILAAWGIMVACDIVCVGLGYGYYSNLKK